ncbi:MULTISPECIES: DUF1997 domain-containing protein [unclassified Roseofilum]|uniref:DUF1997 domain-containing protein n=1 Tax=unclassified Roseofilum TaxID=2620099 RepID=UPI001B126266|nr:MULTISPECIES: DUF1997 domain-containing protein [unclassified Roseofilum]MBP0008262.1 DUF1997 domain-containing protein [Roseofilum sp. Belize Diploria]MBP0032767.1 DUF1997 domain-containing protein [Roseofilum sp. Belize BBD 4]
MTTQFSATQSVNLNVPPQPIPIQHYLRQPKRLVNALTAESQIEHLSDEICRLKMRPLTFMMFTFQPTVDLKVWADARGNVQLQSVNCHIRGIEYINQRFRLDLKGKLCPQQYGDRTTLHGKANLVVQVELPPPLNLTPSYILENTGNGLLRSVLLTIKQRLMHQLLWDYRHWVQNSQSLDKPQPSNAPNLEALVNPHQA